MGELFVATVGTVAIATGAAFLVAETWDGYGRLREEACDILPHQAGERAPATVLRKRSLLVF